MRVLGGRVRRGRMRTRCSVGIRLLSLYSCLHRYWPFLSLARQRRGIACRRVPLRTGIWAVLAQFFPARFHFALSLDVDGGRGSRYMVLYAGGGLLDQLMCIELLLAPARRWGRGRPRLVFRRGCGLCGLYTFHLTLG